MNSIEFIFDELEGRERGAIEGEQNKDEAAVGAGGHGVGGGRHVVPARGSRRREGNPRQQGDPLQRQDRFPQVRGTQSR